jgi:hypothetical protein
VICGQIVNEAQIRSIIDEIKHVIAESSRRKGELSERVKSEDFDAEEAELLRDEREQEVEIFKNIGYLVMILIKTFKAAFLPFLDELSSYIMPMTGEDKTTEERNTCIYVFDHLVGHCGEAALKWECLYEFFLNKVTVLIVTFCQKLGTLTHISLFFWTGATTKIHVLERMLFMDFGFVLKKVVLFSNLLSERLFQGSM